MAVRCYEVGGTVAATDSVIQTVVSATRPVRLGGVDDALAVLELELELGLR